MTRIAVIGGGKIGEALIAGLLQTGYLTKNLVVVERSQTRITHLSEQFSIRIDASITSAAEGADVIIIAVKPSDVDQVIRQLAPIVGESEQDQIIASLAAGIPTSRYEALLPAGFPVVRVMPNTPILIGQGVSVLAGGRYAKDDHLHLLEDIFSSVGTVMTVPETALDAVTAVSGSGPAYFFLIAEAMIEAAVELGLSRPIATELVIGTAVGSAAMLSGTKENGESPYDLRAQVVSPGGTTAAAIRELEQNGIRAGFFKALTAAKDRSIQLGAR